MLFFKALVNGTKRVMNQDEFKDFFVRKFPELPIDFALKQVKDDPNLLIYIPNHWFRLKQKIDRDYLWSVIHSKYPDFVKQLVANANR